MAVKHLYVVHHSHTDIGYTDLQEKVLYNHIDYIKTAADIINNAEKTGKEGFRWNCETYFCVEQFLAEATEEEKKAFFEAVKKGGIGISATYLNFNDLADAEILNERTAEMVQIFKEQEIEVKTAMNADINGISMGARDALINNGIEFLFTNIHTHHGMYPLYKNQTAYFWENDEGKRILVFSGEHYNLGNALGLVHNKKINFMTQSYFGSQDFTKAPVDTLKSNIDSLLKGYEQDGYPYDFVVASVSGVFSDNAPPNTDIIDLINEYNQKYGDVKIEMVTVDELYNSIREKVADAPVYKGDLTDWWANGIGSAPYYVKHYKEAVKNYRLCKKLGGKELYPQLMREAEDNLLIYAEHTFGHSSTVSNPYDTMVLNLDVRKNSYASKAHEATAKVLNRILHKLGDKLRYYDMDGKIKAVNPQSFEGKMPVEFYVEAYFGNPPQYPKMVITNEKTGEEFIPQMSAHPRGVLISFIDSFKPMEEKVYSFKSSPYEAPMINSRKAFIGAERIPDIISDYDSESYKLLHRLENDFFSIKYDTREGVTSFYNKSLQCEMLKENEAKFFTPLYENTKITSDVYDDRRVLGRNIRDVHAKLYQGKLINVKALDLGPVFKTVELVFELEGTYQSSVVIKMYNEIPRIDFKYKVAKTLSEDIESLFLPIALNLPQSESYIDKGSVKMRPGIDQLPGAGMEYFSTDNGVVYVGKEKSVIVNTKDVPLIYQGDMYHHEIKLCDNKPENNQRNIYSWIMNNTWETNFKMDLSGFCEYCYTLSLSDSTEPQKAVDEMADTTLGTLCFIIE